jgi:hypothetical protein
MATGGVFTIITNDGKQDRMLMATQMLRNRLEAIRAKRRADPSIADETPTLLDIERTHILFTNAHFKPFVAIGYEYNKVQPASGNPQLGSEVQFSIPQFGDFFNDMCVYVNLTAPVLVDAAQSNADKASSRWCDYPGERLLQSVKFDVNGNPLDQYNSDATVFHRQFMVQPNKKLAWDRCMAQQVPKEAVLLDSAALPAARQVKLQVLEGPQTPIVPTPTVELQGLTMFIPLLFWCNTDPRLSVPSVAIPYGQRFINLQLASAAQMTGYQLRGAGVDANITFSAPSISQIYLYINNIFVNPEIHKIFIKRIGFTLIRVHRQQVLSTQTPEAELLLQNLKWPIETLFVGFRPTAQKSSLADWHKFTKVSHDIEDLPILSGAAYVAGPPIAVATTQAQAEIESHAKTIDRLTVSAHGIYLYNDIPADFFNSYTCYTFGGPHINSPSDEGALMIPFNLYPGSYQPSGHVNISRAREFYFKYSSSVIGSLDASGSPIQGELSILGKAINFLLISDGSAVLRYST